MNPECISEIKSPFLDSDENQYRETANNPLSEESKEPYDMDEYKEELSNIAIQEQFFFDAGDKRIVSVGVVLKSKALYINLQEEGDKR